MSNLLLRFLTAVVAVPLLILAINWDRPYGVWLWVLAALPLGMLLIRRHWVGLLPQLLASVQRGDAPLPLLLGGLRVGIAGLLLMMPGVLSDVLALILLLPVWPQLQPVKVPTPDDVYEGEYQRVTEPQSRLKS